MYVVRYGIIKPLSALFINFIVQLHKVGKYGIVRLWLTVFRIIIKCTYFIVYLYMECTYVQVCANIKLANKNVKAGILVLPEIIVLKYSGYC